MKRIYSLKNKKIFNSFFNNKDSKNSIKTTNFILLWSKNVDDVIKIGIVVSKKKFNAVKRNKIKRIIRLLAKNFLNSKEGFNIVILIKNNILLIDKNTLEKEFTNMFSNFRTLCKIEI